MIYSLIASIILLSSQPFDSVLASPASLIQNDDSVPSEPDLPSDPDLPRDGGVYPLPHVPLSCVIIEGGNALRRSKLKSGDIVHKRGKKVIVITKAGLDLTLTYLRHDSQTILKEITGRHYVRVRNSELDILCRSAIILD